jgi:hypothetical protein|tara:strand:+ start:9719 stop:10210 length:492 start_codon:yes stop_codon:yes gene_type:complete
MAQVVETQEMFFTAFEPKTQNRFIMYIDGLPSYLIKATARPNLAIDVQTIDHINIKRKLRAGKAEWQDISITLYDPVVPSGAQAAMEWIRLSHESVTGRNGYADFYKKDLTINVLGPVGDYVEEWTIKGAFVNNMNPGTLDWSTGEFSTVELTLSYDYAILQY